MLQTRDVQPIDRSRFHHEKPHPAMNHDQLKTRQRAERHAHPPNLALRVHRAISWLHRAEQLAGEGDKDGEFIFLWIAFNAAYATEIDDRYRLNEQATFRAFLQKLADLDAAQGRFADLVWTEFSSSIRVLLDNPYVFQDFWSFHNGSMPEDKWKRRFADANEPRLKLTRPLDIHLRAHIYV